MRRLVLLAALLLAVPASASGQSLFNAAGLGLPADPLDGRTRALGGVGIGLRGPALLGSDPAAAADFLLPTAVMTVRPTWVDFGRADSGEEGSFRGTRFPALGVAYPVWRGVIASLSFESILDQRYEARWPSTVELGGSPVEVDDHFVSTGGVSQIRFGVARRLAPSLAVGVSASRLTGSVTRRLVRRFGEGVDTTVVEPFQAGGFWSYSGAAVTGGAALSLGSVATVSGSVTWSGGLDAEASDDTEGSSRSYDLPLEFRVGASGILAPGLTLAAGYTTADWSTMAGDLREGASARSVRSFGVGVEMDRARLLGRNAPLRFGYRSSDLPFSLDGGAASETVWAGGFGLNLSQAGEIVRAGVDLGLERGKRTDGSLSETFWRGTFTVRVSGY